MRMATAIGTMLWIVQATAVARDSDAAALDAVRRAKLEPTTANLRAALDLAYRTDSWHAGLEVAQFAWTKPEDVSEPLRSRVVRAYWRAGRIVDAERVAEKLKPDPKDRVGLTQLITLALARGDVEIAKRVAEVLASQPSLSAGEWYALAGVHTAAFDAAKLRHAVTRVEELVDPEAGYPDNVLAGELAGVAEFYEQIGPKPTNQIADYGQAPLPFHLALRLATVEVLINGQGPFTFLVDTGGSTMISIDAELARDIGIETLSTGKVQGVSGETESGLALLDDVRIGGIQLRRVHAHTFSMPITLRVAADGVLGTGIFTDGRLRFDFERGVLELSESGTSTAPGAAFPFRLIADAKIVAPVEMESEPVAALLDTGADAVVLASSFLKRRFPNAKPIDVPLGEGVGIGSGGEMNAMFTPGVNLRLWGATYENYSGLGLSILDDLLGPALGMQTDVLVGMSIFREMRSLTIDFPQRKLWVQWIKPPPQLTDK